MSNSKRKEIFILILCLLIGFAMRFYNFDQKSLWLDEIHTYNDSRDDIQGQLIFFKENPTYLHPPLFFILTHLFFPFPEPERDLRIIPLIFGTLSIPMIYLLARSFSPGIALPCTFSLTFMAYHISLSQDGRSYTLLMFIGMVALYFFIKYLNRLEKRYLFLTGFFFSILFYTSYSSILFIILSQFLWFYQANEGNKRPPFSSFLVLNGFIILLCIPWIIFLGIQYKGQPFMDPFHREIPVGFFSIIYGVLHDWVPHAPLMIFSVILLILFPFYSESRRNAFVLLAVFVFPIGGLYLYCKILNVTHFVTSRYFIIFLPIFFTILYFSLNTMEIKFKDLKRFLRLRFLFAILFIASNLIILPIYYRAEKQDFRRLVTYFKSQLGEGDKIFDFEMAYMPGILFYFGIRPEGRQRRAKVHLEGAGLPEANRPDERPRHVHFQIAGRWRGPARVPDQAAAQAPAWIDRRGGPRGLRQLFPGRAPPGGSGHPGNPDPERRSFAHGGVCRVHGQ